MLDRRLHLDVNAGAPLRAEAREAMLAAYDRPGNASSVHAEGRAARRIVEEAREVISRLMQVRPADLVFTSGASEAANTVLTPKAPRLQNPAPLSRLLLGATEHACVLNGHHFAGGEVEIIPVNGDGLIDIGWLEARVAELTEQFGPASVMVAVQAANNETGVLQPQAEIERRLRESGAMIVADAAQTAGKLPVVEALLFADATLISAHKFGGPQGVGAIAYGGDHFAPEPLIRGGGQERSRRAGTENVAAIAGFAAAAEAAFAEAEDFASRTKGYRDQFEAFVRREHPNAVIFGEGAERLPNTSCLAIPGVSAETLLIALDLAGMSVSSGSACSSGKVTPSHVLRAMGVPTDLARSAIRVSFGWDFQPEDLNMTLRVWKDVLAKILGSRGVRAA